ncbi:MAG: dienelactone hydrolase family protein [Alphaproteobacteria bacterium]
MADRIELTIGDITTDALAASPDGAGPFPGIVVGFHKGGLDDLSEWVVDDLAANGYAALAPNHYHVLPEGVSIDDRRDYLTDKQLAEDLMAAADRLVADYDVDGDRIGLLGLCMGGRTTWVGLVSNPERWKWGGVWYGGSSFKALGDGPAPFDRLVNIACPVGGFFGNDDKNPSPEDVDKIEARLTELGKDHEFHRYDGAGHAFMGFGASRRENAAKESWAIALKLMGRYLGAEASVPA